MRHATILLLATALLSPLAHTADAQIAWESKLREAHSKAKASGKLMLLHFYTDNCIHCERLEQGAFRSTSVCATINDNFVPVKVHGGKNPKLAEMFKVTKFPTDVIVTTEGKAMSHTVSPQQPDRYIAMLSGAKANFLKAQTMLAAGKQPAEPAARVAKSSATPAPNTPASNTPASPTAGISLPIETAAEPATNQTPANGMVLPQQVAAATEPSKPQTNQFVLPEDTAGTGSNNSTAVDASLASARSEAKAAAPTTATPSPDLAIDGFCPVSVVNKGAWIEGNPELGVVHLGKLYLFADQASMELFLADPVPFTPMLNEIDVVRFFEDKKIVPGKREWGLIDPIHNRMYFFADEAAMLHFEKSFERYLDAAIEVMDYAIEEANPGV